VENREEGKQASDRSAGVVGGNDLSPIHANIVTMVLTEDQLVLEFREWHAPHTSLVLVAEKVTVPTLTPDGFRGLPPLGVVVLTFAAARDMQKYLNRVLPVMQESRAMLRPESA